MSELKVSLERRNGGVVLALAGAVGIDDAQALEKQVNALVAERPPVVVVDLSKLTFMSSVGMTALVTLHRGLKQAGGVVRIVGPSTGVFGVLDRARIIELMPVFPTVERAIA